MGGEYRRRVEDEGRPTGTSRSLEGWRFGSTAADFSYPLKSIDDKLHNERLWKVGKTDPLMAVVCGGRASAEVLYRLRDVAAEVRSAVKLHMIQCLCSACFPRKSARLSRLVGLRQ